MRVTDLNYELREIERELDARGAGELRERVRTLVASAQVVAARERPSLPGAPYESVPKAARLLGVSPNTMKRWVAAGTFRGVIRTPGGQARIPTVEIDRLRETSSALADVFGPLA
jgi:hypothetical protein